MLVKSEVISKADELNGMAAKLLPMPDGLTQPEQLLYKSLCLLYREYRSRQITEQQAKQEKKELYRTYIDNAYQVDLWQWNMKISHAFQLQYQEIKVNGCEVCRKLANILCGLGLEEHHESST